MPTLGVQHQSRGSGIWGGLGFRYQGCLCVGGFAGWGQPDQKEQEGQDAERGREALISPKCGSEVKRRQQV